MGLEGHVSLSTMTFYIHIQESVPYVWQREGGFPVARSKALEIIKGNGIVVLCLLYTCFMPTVSHFD